MADVSGMCHSVLALYMDWGYKTKQFISLLDACNNADQRVERFFTVEFEAQMFRGGWVQCCPS